VYPVLALVIAGTVLIRLAVYAGLALPFGGLAEAMCQFDCGWYERIAMAGYGADADWPPHGSLPHWAFFPLYPLLLRGTVAVTGLPARVAGIALSSLCLAGFMAAGAAYLRRTRGAAAAPGRFVVLAAVMPFGLFFSALYTEALFALLATLALLGLANARPAAGALAAALAGATRPTGILLAPLFALRGLLAWRREGARGLLPAAIAPLGLVVYMAAQWIAVGDPLAFSHVQMLWDRVWRDPLVYLWDGLAAWDWSQLGGMMTASSRSFLAAWGVLGLAVAAWLAARRRWAEAWLLAAGVLLPASSGLDSLPRYVVCNPAFLFAAHDLLAGRGRRTAAVVLAGLAVAGVVPLLAWMQAHGGVF
jgi:hypothetical protein